MAAGEATSALAPCYTRALRSFRDGRGAIKLMCGPSVASFTSTCRPLCALYDLLLRLDQSPLCIYDEILVGRSHCPLGASIALSGGLYPGESRRVPSTTIAAAGWPRPHLGGSNLDASRPLFSLQDGHAAPSFRWLESSERGTCHRGARLRPYRPSWPGTSSLLRLGLSSRLFYATGGPCATPSHRRGSSHDGPCNTCRARPLHS